MRGVDAVRAAAERSKKAKAKQISSEERAKKRQCAKIRKNALSQVDEFTKKCIKAAKKAAREDSTNNVASVILNDSEASWIRGCYQDAVKKVVKNLIDEGFHAKVTWSENHGHINSDEVYEYHYEIGVQIGW